MKLHYLLLIFLIATLSACGFKLRGAGLESLKQSPVYLNSTGAPEVASEVRKQIMIAEIPLATAPAEADYIINLNNEAYEQRILSISPQTGKVEEYQLSYRVMMSVTGPDKKQLMQPDAITTERDYSFDETAALGKFEESATLRREMSEQAAQAVLRRLEAVIRSD